MVNFAKGLESIGVAELKRLELSWDRLTFGAHWSPLELKIMNIGVAKLIQTVLTIGAHWSCRSMTTLVEPGPAYLWSPLESIGVEDFEYRHG